MFKMDEDTRQMYDRLTKTQKIQHIWEYNKHIIVGAVIGLIIIIYVIYLLFRPQPEYIFSVTAINSAITSQESITLDEEYLEKMSLESEGQIEIMTNITTEEDMSSSASNFISAMLLSEELDVLMWDKEAVELVVTGEVTVNLAEYISKEYLEKYADDFLYATKEGNEEKYIVGVYFNEDSRVCEEFCMNEAYAGIALTSQNADKALRFLEYLLDLTYGDQN